MKTFLKLLVVLFFISSAAFPQNFIKRNDCRRFIGETTHCDFIINESTIIIYKFDSLNFCKTVTKIYQKLNLDIISGKEGLCMMGFSTDNPNEYSVSLMRVDEFMFLKIMNTSEENKVYSKDEFKNIRKFQVELAERIMRDVRKYI